jgi:hypothetical protein
MLLNRQMSVRVAGIRRTPAVPTDPSRDGYHPARSAELLEASSRRVMIDPALASTHHRPSCNWSSKRASLYLPMLIASASLMLR